MKTIFKLLLLALVFTSCEDVEPTVFNGLAVTLVELEKKRAIKR